MMGLGLIFISVTTMQADKAIKNANYGGKDVTSDVKNQVNVGKKVSDVLGTSGFLLTINYTNGTNAVISKNGVIPALPGTPVATSAAPVINPAQAAQAQATADAAKKARIDSINKQIADVNKQIKNLPQPSGRGAEDIMSEREELNEQLTQLNSDLNIAQKYGK